VFEHTLLCTSLLIPSACETYHTITAYTTVFPEDEPMGLKHVEDSKIKN